jgi:hypothetical protein
MYRKTKSAAIMLVGGIAAMGLPRALVEVVAG